MVSLFGMVEIQRIVGLNLDKFVVVKSALVVLEVEGGESSENLVIDMIGQPDDLLDIEHLSNLLLEVLESGVLINGDDVFSAVCLG